MNMRYVTAWVAAMVCAALGSASLLAAFAPSSPVNVDMTVDFQVNQRVVPAAFVGVSVSASAEGNGVSQSGVATSAAGSTAELRPKMLRFPDDISQSFHWANATPDGLMNTFELWSLADAADVPNIMLTVNMVTGAPNEARDWVAYCNLPATTPEGGLRAAQAGGSQVPFDVRYWLLGEDIRAYPATFETADAYIDAALRNASLMKSASPGVQVGIWLDDGTTQDGRNWNDAALTRLRLADPGQNTTTGQRLIDFVATSVRVEVPNRPLTDGALYPSLYAAAEARANGVLTDTEARVQIKLRVPVPIAVYRYSVDFGAEGWNQDKADSLGTALALAGMVNAFIGHDQLLTTIYAGLNRDGFEALIKVPSAFDLPVEQRFALNAFGEVLSAYGQLASGHSLTLSYAGSGNPSEAARAHFHAPALGRWPAAASVALVSGAATLDSENGQMALFLASRSLTDRVVVHLTVKNTAPRSLNASAYVQTVAGDALSTDAYTGVVHLRPRATQEDLESAPPEADVFHFTFTLERDSFTSFAFQAPL